MTIARYRVDRDYIGVVGGVTYNLQANAELHLSAHDAELVNADQLGTLFLVNAPIPPDAPNNDRMKHAPGQKRTRG
jgi:hypothetical protein